LYYYLWGHLNMAKKWRKKWKNEEKNRPMCRIFYGPSFISLVISLIMSKPQYIYWLKIGENVGEKTAWLPPNQRRQIIWPHVVIPHPFLCPLLNTSLQFKPIYLRIKRFCLLNGNEIWEELKWNDNERCDPNCQLFFPFIQQFFW
jgi:hypothetical protein